jgi:hypothetical protein
VARPAGEEGGVSHNHEVAHRLAAAGLPVFPCGLDKRAQPGCRWTRQASTYANCVTGMWRRFGADSMVGIHCGKAGLFVVDLDRHEGKPDGVAAFDKLVDQYGGIPPCPITETPSEGLHLYFRQPAGKSLGLRTGSLPPGIDVRGVGGIIIAPGSVRSDDGTFYGRRGGTPDLLAAFAAGTIPEIVPWLVELIEAGSYKPQPSINGSHDGCSATDGNRGRKWALAALDREARDLAITPCGRNAALNKAAYNTGGHAWLGITEGEAQDALGWASTANGWIAKKSMNAFRATFESGWNSGIKKPRSGPRDAPAMDIEINIKSKARV